MKNRVMDMEIKIANHQADSKDILWSTYISCRWVIKFLHTSDHVKINQLMEMIAKAGVKD